MLYTGKGDDGTTGTFGCSQRFSKSSVITEALGTLDEINSYLGIIKTSTALPIEKVPVMLDIQNTLFIIQAEVAGAQKHVPPEAIDAIESLIDDIGAKLPPIKTFFISGGTELAARFDFARTIARRAERRVVAVHDEGIASIHPNTLIYLNRLSSLLYALAREANQEAKITEENPIY